MSELLTLYSLYSDIADLVRTENPCAPSIPLLESLDDGKTTFMEAMNSLPDGYLYWAFIKVRKYIDEDTRVYMLARIMDPTQCLRLYIDIPDLTDKEQLVLEESFKDKLPNAEWELRRGIVVRTL